MSVLIDDELYTVIVPGDINASGTVNTADMRLLQRVLVGETELTDTAALAADLNENGRPDAADLVRSPPKCSGTKPHKRVAQGRFCCGGESNCKAVL